MSTEPGTTPPPGSDHPAADLSANPSSSTHTESSVVVVAPRIRQPLNPAYAILFGALVTAASGITAAVLSIRSSERLSTQQDKTSAAVQANQELQRKVDQLDRALEAASQRLATLSSSTIPVAAPPGPLPSIVVVLPTPDPAFTLAPPTAPITAPAAIPATSAPTVATANKATSTTVPASVTTVATASALPATAASGPATSTAPVAASTTSSTTTSVVAGATGTALPTTSHL